MSNFLKTENLIRDEFAGLRSKQIVPVNPVLVLGRSQLIGALEGFMAIELGPDNTATGGKLWTMYTASGGFWSNQNPRMLPYTRICASPSFQLRNPEPLSFWVNPSDVVTQAAGFGSGWLLRTKSAQRMGLVLVQLNTLMLDAQALETLLPDSSLKAASSFDDFSSSLETAAHPH